MLPKSGGSRFSPWWHPDSAAASHQAVPPVVVPRIWHTDLREASSWRLVGKAAPTNGQRSSTRPEFSDAVGVGVSDNTGRIGHDDAVRVPLAHGHGDSPALDYETSTGTDAVGYPPSPAAGGPVPGVSRGWRPSMWRQ